MTYENVSRRQVLTGLGATGAVALAGCVGDGDDDGAADGETVDDIDDTFSIGILQDFSGPLPDYGAQGTTGFYSGLAYKADDDPLPADSVDEGDYEYSIGDVDIELLVRDSASDPSEAQELAEELATTDEVDLLYGSASSGGANRIITNVVDRTEIPYIAGPAAAAEITNESDTCREIVFRANENTAMDARSGGVYIAEATDVDQIALFGADDDFGRSVVNGYRQVLEERGVDIVEERFVPGDYAEWGGLIDQAEDAGAEGMVGGFTAEALIPFASTFLTGEYDLQLFGGFASRVTLGPVGETLEEVLGDDFTNEGIESASFGPFTTRYHWNQYDNEINDRFVEMHTETYDIVPDLFTGGAFTAASAVVQSFEQAGEASSDAIVEQMRGMIVEDTPKGENGYEFQEYNNQARSDMTVAPVEVTPDDEEYWPASIMPGEPIERVSAEDVTTPADAEEMTCDLS